MIDLRCRRNQHPARCGVPKALGLRQVPFTRKEQALFAVFLENPAHFPGL